MHQIVLNIRDKKKGKSLVDFLKQIDFIEVNEINNETDYLLSSKKNKEVLLKSIKELENNKVIEKTSNDLAI